MTEKEKLDVIKHSYEVLQSLVKDLTERVKDAREGIATSDQNLIMGSLYGLDCTAERIRNVYAVMTYLHTNRGSICPRNAENARTVADTW